MKHWTRPEVQKQSDFDVRSAQVVLELARRVRRKELCRLELDNHLVIHEHVDSLPGDAVLLVEHPYLALARYSMPASNQLAFKCDGVHRLTKSITKGVIALVETADDRVRPSLLGQTSGALNGHATRCL